MTCNVSGDGGGIILTLCLQRWLDARYLCPSDFSKQSALLPSVNSEMNGVWGQSTDLFDMAADLCLTLAVCFEVITQEKTIHGIEVFDKQQLKHAETEVKNPLPDKKSEWCICVSVVYVKCIERKAFKDLIFSHHRWHMAIMQLWYLVIVAWQILSATVSWDL